MADEEKTDLQVELTPGAYAKVSDQIRVRTDRFGRFYANSVAVKISMWDLSFIFGEILGEENGKPVIEEIAQVTVTREVAKAFAGILVAHLREFERIAGEIKIPTPLKTEEENEGEGEGDEESKPAKKPAIKTTDKPTASE